MTTEKVTYAQTDIVSIKLGSTAKMYDKMKELTVLVNHRMRQEPGWTVAGPMYMISNVLTQQIVRNVVEDRPVNVQETTEE